MNSIPDTAMLIDHNRQMEHNHRGTAYDRPVWGEGVRILRGVAGLSRAELAERARTPEALVEAIEAGYRGGMASAEDCGRIAGALGVDPRLLFPHGAA